MLSPPRDASCRSAHGERRGVYRSIVPDGVVGSEANPLGDGTVLLLGLGQLDLGPETLVALCGWKKCDGQPSVPVNRADAARYHPSSPIRGWQRLFVLCSPFP